MNIASAFVYAVAAQEFIASLVYFLQLDWKRGTLWLCYAVGAVLVTLL